MHLKTRTGLDHGADLGEEYLRVVEGDANAPPAEKRVLLFDGEIGQRLVAPDVERAHGHGAWIERLHVLAVDGPLFLLRGKPSADRERHLRAEQSDALRTPV